MVGVVGSSACELLQTNSKNRMNISGFWLMILKKRVVVSSEALLDAFPVIVKYYKLNNIY